VTKEDAPIPYQKRRSSTKSRILSAAYGTTVKFMDGIGMVHMATARSTDEVASGY
jgi:hypothetical protein